MEKFFQKRVTHYLLIIFVALLSIGQILRLYFGFEDFHLFYIFQDSEEAKRLLVIPEYARHLNQYYFERPLWNLFGYNPFGYNTFTLILSICVYLLYYRFISYVTKNKFIGLISAVYLASAYYGVDSFTWSYNTGFDLMGALAPGIILFAMLFAYLRTKKIRYLLISFIFFPPLVYFFRARTFHFIIIILFICLFYAQMSFKKKLFFLLPFTIIAIFILQKNILHSPYIFHIAIDPFSTALAFFATIGNFFFPSDISEYIYTFFNLQKYMSLDIFEMIIGCGVIVLFFFLFKLLKKSNKKLLPFFFFSVFAVISFIFFLFAASVLESGISIRTTESWGHTMTPVTLWTSALVGLFFATIFASVPKLRKIFIGIFIVLMGINIFLAMNKITTTVETKSKKLKYFYTTLLHYVPSVTKPSVFYFDFATPRPFYPFSSGNPLITANSYIASYYRTNDRNIILVDTFDEAMLELKKHNIPFDRFHYFYYQDEHLVYLSPGLQKAFKNPELKSVLLQNNQTNKLFKLSNTNPHVLTYSVSMIPDFEKIPVHPDKQKLINYYELLVQKQEEKRKYRVEVFPGKSSDEYTKSENLIDGDYTTLWLAEKWGAKDVRIILDLGETRKISHIVWASNRNAPLTIRQPGGYSVLVSTDKKNWKQVKIENHAKLLKAHQYYDITFTKIPVQYIQIAIQSTHGNYTPYVDEIEVFGNEFPHFNYATYFSIAAAPLENIPSKEILQKVFNTIYAKKLFYTIDEKMDNQVNWLEDNKKQIPVRSLGEKIDEKIYMPPKGLQLTGIKFSEGNFPLKFTVENLEIKNATKMFMDDF